MGPRATVVHADRGASSWPNPRGASAPAQSRVRRARSCCPSSPTDRIVISVRRQGALRVDAGVTKIDAFVTTHYHEDHFGGIDDLVLLAKVHVLESYDRGDKAFLPASKKAQET